MKQLLRCWIAATSLACIDGPQLDEVVLAADFDGYVRDVQPILEARCANPACHGDPDQPLSLFAVHMNRLDRDDLYSDLPLTDQELRANFVRVCGFLVGLERAWDCPIARKPIPRALGGMAHEGGVIWTERQDPELRTVVAWIETGMTVEEP